MRISPLCRGAGSAVLLATALLLAGCGQAASTDTDTAASGVTTSSAPVTTSAAPTTGQGDEPAPTGTAAASGDPAGAEGLTVTSVRVGEHEEFQRVVFELAGTGTPGWLVEYVDAPSSQGSGAPVDVPGEAYLQVVLTGTSYPYETGAEELGRGPVATGTGPVEGIVYDATFEGQSVAWIGTTGQVPFQVSALSDPSRLVVDVAKVP
ncbi:AMIN-like domain-containing (lipo)protein [Modestobacter roseus]|uniref:AMIN-like domain-containing (lipo)protein n=1 Tax=Modestobacter roseus TaxID=1181884 RepID=UPI0034DEF78D